LVFREEKESDILRAMKDWATRLPARVTGTAWTSPESSEPTPINRHPPRVRAERPASRNRNPMDHPSCLINNSFRTANFLQQNPG